MPNLTCSKNHTFNAPDTEPTARCPRCQEYVATGSEEAIRKAWEQTSAIQYPKVTAVRSMALANSIYKTALKKRSVVTMTTAGKKLAKKGYDGQIVRCELIKGRSHGGLTQDSCTAAIVAIDNGSDKPVRISIYVIFRGSSSDDNVGGWVKDRSINLDWRANFDNRMETTDYASPDIRVHRGFKSVILSYRAEVRRGLNEMRRQVNANGHRHHTVVTGHSQGAAHALLFAHWLAYVEREAPVFCMPFSPPRVGDYSFAQDFTRLVTDRAAVLPYDGMRTQSAFLMVKGEDPVSFNQKRAFGPSDDKRNKIVDSSTLLGKGIKAGKWEANSSVANEPYFHPKNLVLLGSSTPKLGLLRAYDHDPHAFRSKLLREL